nr:hypothetical protein [Tanacetum cinerariifolium]
NHREEEDQEGNNSPKIETLTYHVQDTYGRGPTPTPISVNSCVVNSVRFIMHSRDEHRTTQNNGICSPGGKDGEINEGRKVKHLVLRNNMTQILTKGEAFKDDQYILTIQVKQCFYLEDMARRQPTGSRGPTPTPISVNSCVVNSVRFIMHSRDEHRTTQNNGICSPGGKDGEINNMTQILTKGEAFKDDQYILTIQVKQCFYLEDMARRQPTGSLNDLDNATLHIDGQSMKVDAPLDIIDLDEEDDIIDDEDACQQMWHGATIVTVAVMIVPLHTIYLPVVGVASLNEQRHPKNLIWAEGKRARNLGLKKITDEKGPVPIRFEWDDRKTLMPLGDHASHSSNYLGELIREMPLYYRSWQKTQLDLTPHMQSQRWIDINTGIQQHLKKFYNTNKASLKAVHWVINSKTETYDVESIRQRRPQNITPADWDAQIAFWNDPRNQARATQNHQNQAKSTIVCWHRSRSLARLRDQMMESSPIREYPSLIQTFFVTHTFNGVFTQDEDRAIYKEMFRLQALGSNTPSGVPYTEEEINALARKGKQRGHLPGIVRYESTPEFGNSSGSGGCGDDEMASDEDGNKDKEDEEDGDS